MNKERLRKLATIIRREHKHFDMGAWCGTTGCIAGFAVADFHPFLWEDYEDAFRKLNDGSYDGHVPDNGTVKEAAVRLLELNRDEVYTLFYPIQWPRRYRGRYYNSNTSRDRAEVAAKYLEYLAK